MRCDKEKLRKAMRLYAVTDRSWLCGKTFLEQVEEALKAGVTCLQLREKDLSFDDFLSEAQAIQRIAQNYQIPFIINDNIDVAIKCGADGVHIGQSDTEMANARMLLGEDKIIGVSVHNVKEALEAEAQGADYLGVGAAFSTSTKSDVSSISFDEIKAITDSASIPVVAIGGINSNNILQLSGTGVDGVAVVSAIFAQKNIAEATAALLALSEKMAGI